MITVTLEKAKKLEEYGRDKATYFFYTEEGELLNQLYYKNNMNIGMLSGQEPKMQKYRSPTAQEILDELPRYIRDSMLVIDREDQTGDNHMCLYRSIRYTDREEWEEDFGHTYGDNLANALADLRIRCKKNGYLDLNIEN